MSGRQNKYPERYPPIDYLKNIFFADSRVINLIHYNTDQPDYLLDQLVDLIKFGGPNLHGFQLNVPWPEIQILQKFRKTYPEKKIVLQISSQAMGEADFEPSQIADMIKKYLGANTIDGVLFDSSGGKGTLGSFPYYRKCIDRLIGHEISLGVAGGLREETLWNIRKYFFSFYTLCLDAEGGLRDRQDWLDIQKASTYVAEAQSMFNEWGKIGKTNIANYTYCPKHDIFFNQTPNTKKTGFGRCPLCLQNAFAGEYDPQRTLHQGSEDLTKI